MPEGDTVWRAASRLNELFAGRPLSRCDLRWPTLATVDLTALRMTSPFGPAVLF